MTCGILYVVGTPIGNLGDFSPRGRETLSGVDFIAAEDTRVTRKLLSAFAIPTCTTISCHEHNIREKTEEIILRLQQGENGAVVTDAGMPCISDPGQQLIAALRDRGMPIAVVPGPTAVTSALAVSGLNTDHFYFGGFLPREKKERIAALSEVCNLRCTMIFYEAPHRLQKTLSAMAQVLGDRQVSLCKELTKRYEEVEKTTLCAAVSLCDEKEPRGEYVVVVEGNDNPELPSDAMGEEEAVSLAKSFMAQGLSLSKAAAKAAAASGIRKNILYSRCLEDKEI